MDRDEFMELVYETFADEPDNVLANGIIEAADAYAEYEKAQLSQEGTTSDLISRQAARHALCKAVHKDEDIPCDNQTASCLWTGTRVCDYVREIDALPSVQPSQNKYEYHYDHTACIWYRPEARNRCPTTCAQYRDGWNDAMNYIFRDGEGYRPFRRDKKYDE